MSNLLISRNPTSGETLRELEVTPADELPKIFDRARAAQVHWSALSVKKRAAYLIQLREVLLNQVEDIEKVLHEETGKPRFEALMNEIFPSADILSIFAKKAPDLLATKRIPMHVMRHRHSVL